MKNKALFITALLVFVFSFNFVLAQNINATGTQNRIQRVAEKRQEIKNRFEEIKNKKEQLKLNLNEAKKQKVDGLVNSVLQRLRNFSNRFDGLVERLQTRMDLLEEKVFLWIIPRKNLKI